MDSRSPEDKAAGILRINIGGEERLVPTLSIAATREWQQGLAKGPSAFVVPVNEDDWTASNVAAFAGLSMTTLLDLVSSYDVTGKLGGRAWLEDHADPSQLFAAATAMAEVAYPFAADVPMLLAGLVVVRGVVASKQQSSTNGHSPTGGSTRGRSKRSSTRPSSRSSGTPARSG